MSHHPTIAVVGSGPIGSAYARLLLEGIPDARVVMFEAGPQLTERPGESVRNIADPVEKARARERSQGPQAGEFRESLGIPSGTVVEGMFTARQGTHLLDFGGEGSAHAPTFPAAAGATNVGGQGAHWTCAIPRPAFSEKVPFIADDEWEELIDDRGGPAARAERRVRGLRRRRRHPLAARGGVRGRAARRLRPEHAPGRGRPAARRHHALGGRRLRAGPADRAREPARRALRAARPDARAPGRARRRRRHRRHGRGPAHARDVLRARRPRRGRRRRVPLPAAAVGVGHPPGRARALPHGASGRDLDGRARRRPDRPLRDRGAARRGARAPRDERGGPGGGGQPHPVLGARPPVLAAGDVLRDDAVPDGARRPPRAEPVGLREHGLRHAQAPALRGCRDVRRRRARLPRLPEHDDHLRAHGDGARRDRGRHRAAAPSRERARHVRRRAAPHAERLEPALPGHAAHGRRRRRHLGRRSVVARLGLREPRRRRQRPHPDRHGDEPDAHERRDRGAGRAQGRRALRTAGAEASVAG